MPERLFINPNTPYGRMLREAEAALAARGPRYHLYSAAELDDLPGPEWIVDDAIPSFGIVGVLGPKGTLKTFTTLLIALSVALGRPIHGKRAKRRSVLYVYAEGSYGAKMRLNAACEYLGYQDGVPINRDSLPMTFLPQRVPVNDEGEMALLIAEVEKLPTPPEVIIIDTLNANLDGDEDGKGMNAFMAGCYALRDKYSACVIVVHHTPLSDANRGRGHTSFDGALDTRLIVSRDADRVTVECTHQRNGADGWRWDFETLQIAGSLALREVGPSAGKLTGNRRLVLEEAHEGPPRKYSPLSKATGLPATSFKRALGWLKSNAYIMLKGQEYQVTEAGKQALGATGPSVGPT